MLMAFWEVQRLTREINNLERDAMRVRTRLVNYQKYAEALGKSTMMPIGLGMQHIAGLPPELIPRATLFAQYSEQASSMNAMQQLQMMKMTGRVPWLGNQTMQYQFEMSAYNQFKLQSLQVLKQQEAYTMKEIETEIQQEMNSIETRIKEKKAMLDSCKNLLKEEVQNFTPKFGLG